MGQKPQYTDSMKIGIFDSGLGGLFTMRRIVSRLPRYDYVYLGDTKRIPYGDRSRETVYRFLEEAVDFLFRRDCGLVVVACNTASAEALRRIQTEYLPRHYPDRKVLGVIIPAAEQAVKNPGAARIGILATRGTVRSGTFAKEVRKLRRGARVFQNAAPLLVPLIERRAPAREIRPALQSYLQPLLRKRIDTLILGCTHYAIIKRQAKAICGPQIRIIAQDEILPAKLAAYLRRHPEVETRLGKGHSRRFLVTDLMDATKILAQKWFQGPVAFTIVRLPEQAG